MALSRDLLSQARSLAQREPSRPRQASLRRAVSAAYYALFHLLGEELGAQCAPGRMRRFGVHFQRALNHGAMNEVANKIVGWVLRPGQQNRPAKMFEGMDVSDDLYQVADAFRTLQQARHAADYDVGRRFSRAETLELVATAERAFSAWRKIRTTDEGAAFLVALLLWKHSRT